MEISGKPIAVGRTAEIYPWEDERILKLLRPGFPPGLIKQEEVITTAIYQAGIAAPKIYSVVEVNGRPGIVYERIDGPSLAGLIESHPFRLREHAALLARLHATIHTHTYSRAPEGSPRQKKILAQQVQAAEVLPEAVRKAVLSLLNRLPDGDILCHNDFHPWNVLSGAWRPSDHRLGKRLAGEPLRRRGAHHLDRGAGQAGGRIPQLLDKKSGRFLPASVYLGLPDPLPLVCSGPPGRPARLADRPGGSQGAVGGPGQPGDVDSGD